jgi:hypothetical protein
MREMKALYIALILLISCGISKGTAVVFSRSIGHPINNHKYYLPGKTHWTSDNSLKRAKNTVKLGRDLATVSNDMKFLNSEYHFNEARLPLSPLILAQSDQIFSPNGRYLARKVGIGQDRHYEVIDQTNNNRVLTTRAQYSTPNDVKSGIFSSDSRSFAVTYHYGHQGNYTWLGVWSNESGQLLSGVKTSGWLRIVSLTPQSFPTPCSVCPSPSPPGTTRCVQVVVKGWKVGLSDGYNYQLMNLYGSQFCLAK